MIFNQNMLNLDRDFATCSLFGSGYTRLSKVPSQYKTKDYDQKFDADTLWVDAVHSKGKVVLVCPRLNNLRESLLTAQFRLDGVRIKARIREYRRHALIELPAKYTPSRVSVRIGRWTGHSAINPTDAELFRARNVLFTLSKDNRLEWIHDWARFHARHQGADAVCFVDNGSTDYNVTQIEEAIREAGVAAVKVLRTPLPYGPRGERPYKLCDQFLQTCIMNIARLRFLSQARAVLNCDIDELVHSTGESVFDQALRSRFGFVRFQGSWRYPEPNLQGITRHADHAFRRQESNPCSEKWCLVPKGPLGSMQWRPHSLEHLPFSKLFNERNTRFWHCRGISNDWKNYGRLKPRCDTICDQKFKLELGAIQ